MAIDVIQGYAEVLDRTMETDLVLGYAEYVGDGFTVPAAPFGREGFDSVTVPNMPPGWIVTKLAGTTSTWQSDNYSGAATGRPSPPNSSQFTAYNATANNSARMSYCTPVDISGWASAYLTYWVRLESGNPTKIDTLQPQMSIDGINWANLGNVVSCVGPDGWVFKSIDVSAYIGISFYIGFVGTVSSLGGGRDIRVDDIDIVPFPVAPTSWWLSGGISAANCLAAYQPRGAASQAASYSNLNAPGTNDAIVGVAPLWDMFNGWQFDGSTQYLSSVSVNGGGCTVIIRYVDYAGSTPNARIVGTATSTDSDPRLFIMPGYNSAVYYDYGGSSANLSKSPYLQSGVLAIAGIKAYRNGVLDGTLGGTWSGTNTNPLGIGAQKNATGANYFRRANVQAIAIYNTVLTDAQVLAVSDAMTLSLVPSLRRQSELLMGYAEVIREPAQTDFVMAYAESLAGNDPRPVLGPRWQ